MSEGKKGPNIPSLKFEKFIISVPKKSMQVKNLKTIYSIGGVNGCCTNAQKKLALTVAPLAICGKYTIPRQSFFFLKRHLARCISFSCVCFKIKYFFQ